MLRHSTHTASFLTVLIAVLIFSSLIARMKALRLEAVSEALEEYYHAKKSGQQQSQCRWTKINHARHPCWRCTDRNGPPAKFSAWKADAQI